MANENRYPLYAQIWIDAYIAQATSTNRSVVSANEFADLAVAAFKKKEETGEFEQ